MDALDGVRSGLSHHRLELAFRATAGEPPFDLAARSLYNLALAEALFPALQNLEIALRNRLDEVVGANCPSGTPGRIGSDGLPEAGCWLDASCGVLARWESAEVARVKRSLVSARKAITPHRLIAGLSLGFWTGLFTRAYETGPRSAYVGGAATALWPRHLRAVFPHLPRRLTTRAHAYDSLRRLAELRNQVFHHRPIWRLPLDVLHPLALDTIGWISPDLRDLTASVDRFAAVHAPGLAPHARHLRAFTETRAA